MIDSRVRRAFSCALAVAIMSVACLAGLAETAVVAAPAPPMSKGGAIPFSITPESTGYAVAAFGESAEQSVAEASATTRADVLPFMRSDTAPDFSLQTTQGDFQGLATYHGQFMVVTFWTSWKEECLSSLSALCAAMRRYPEVAVLAVNSLPAENNNAAWTEEAFLGHIDWINSYFDENDYDFPALLDINGQVSSSFKSEQLPMTYFIDRDGVIRIPWPGALTRDTLDTLMDMMSALDRS